MSKEDIFVHIIDMPTSVKETVTLNEDGSASVFLNSCLTREQMLRSYTHALSHLLGNDFDKEDVQAIETNRHKEVIE